MDVTIRGKAGERRTLTGTEGEMRVGPYSEQIVNDVGHGRFFEAAARGRIFASHNSALTIASTHNHGLDNVADTPIVGFLNPVNSGKAAVILGAYFTTISGTPPPSAQPGLYLAYNQTGITAATTGTIVNTFNPSLASAMRALNNIALAGLNTTTSNNLVKMFGGAIFAGAVAANHDAGWFDAVDGQVIVAPGNAIAMLAGSAAGTSWVVTAGLTWAEIDWPV